MGGTAKAQSGHRSGLSGHRPLRPGGEAGRRKVRPAKVPGRQQGPDLRAVRSDPGTAGPHTDARRALQQGGDPADGRKDRA